MIIADSGTIEVNGEKIQIPDNFNKNNVTLINRNVSVGGSVKIDTNRIFVDGREYVDGKWKTTFKALWHKFF